MQKYYTYFQHAKVPLLTEKTARQDLMKKT